VAAFFVDKKYERFQASIWPPIDEGLFTNPVLCRKLILPIFVAAFFVEKKIRAVSNVNMALN